MPSKRIAIAAVSALLGALFAHASVLPEGAVPGRGVAAGRHKPSFGFALDAAPGSPNGGAFGEPGPSGPFGEPAPPEKPLIKPTGRGRERGALRLVSLAGSGVGLALAAFGLGSIATAALDGPDLRAAHRGLAFAASGAALAGLSALLYAEPEP